MRTIRPVEPQRCRARFRDCMERPEPTMRRGESNAATAIALVGLILAGAALLGLMALVLPELLGIVVVVLIFAVPAAFHYVVWGWWLSRMKDEEAESEATRELEDRG